MPTAEKGMMMAPEEAARRTNSPFSGQNSLYSSPLPKKGKAHSPENGVRGGYEASVVYIVYQQRVSIRRPDNTPRLQV